MHDKPHEQAGQTVQVSTKLALSQQSETTLDFRIEDWWDRVSGGSWMTAEGNPAALGYAMRSGFTGLPVDDEVVYGHTEDGLGHLVHVSEIATVVSGDD